MKQDYKDNELYLVRKYRKDNIAEKNCLSIDSAKQRVIDMWRRRELSDHSAGRLLSNIVKNEETYRPNGLCTFQELLAARYNDFFNGFDKVRKWKEEEYLTASFEAITEFILDQRVVEKFCDDNNEVLAKDVYTISGIYGVDDPAILAYDQFVVETAKANYAYEFSPNVKEYIEISKQAMQPNNSTHEYEYYGNIFDTELDK